MMLQVGNATLFTRIFPLMNPAFSVIFLTTLIGVGQGLFVALFSSQGLSAIQLLPAQESSFYVGGSVIALLFLIAGLIASFFHLGHPERAWRAAAKWRTSWLSREVIILPLLMLAITSYAIIHYFNLNLSIFGMESGNLSLVIGTAGVIISLVLFLCTGMIYACIKFLQEWANPLTVINYTLFGLCSGFLFASAYAAYYASIHTRFYAAATILLMIIAFITRIASLVRNARLKQKSNLQSAIGIRHNKIVQKSQGFMGGSFNTRDFFHGVKPLLFKSIKWIFLLLVFAVPLLLIVFGLQQKSFAILACAFIMQYIGLLFERWFFFAQANHPQNLYYQTIS